MNTKKGSSISGRGISLQFYENEKGFIQGVR